MTFALIIGALLLLSTLLTLDGSWMNVLQSVRNTVVFEGRNKEYGAYELRRDYNRRLAVALVGSLLFFGLAIGAPKIIAGLDKEEKKDKKQKIVDVEMTLFEEEVIPPPPPEIIPPEVPKIEELAFVEVEAADEEQKDPPPTQEMALETNISTRDVEGEKGEDAPPPVVDVDNKLYDYNAVQEQAGPPGGMDKWRTDLMNKFKYPEIDAEAGTSGKVWVQFTVDKDGSVTDVSVLRGLSSGLDKEAMRVVKASGKWSPAKMNGHSVKVQYKIPIECSVE